MIGPLEIAILLVVVFIVLLMGGYKHLPSIGRSAGKGAKAGGEKAKQIAATVGEKASEIDTEKIAKAAGDGFREAREVKDALTGKTKEETATPASEESAAEPKREVAPQPKETSTKSPSSSSTE